MSGDAPRLRRRISDLIQSAQSGHRDKLSASGDRILEIVGADVLGASAYADEDQMSVEWTMPGPWEISVEFGDTIDGDATNTRTCASTGFMLDLDCDRATLAAAVQAMFDIARAP